MNIEEMLKHVEEYKNGNISNQKLIDYLMDFGADAYGSGANSVIKNAKNNISVEVLAKIIKSYNRGLIGARNVLQYIVNTL